MGKDYRDSSLRQFDRQSSNLDYLGASISFERQHNTIPGLMNPASDMVPMKETLPLSPSFEPSQTYVDHGNEPRDWFHRLPRFRQVFMPALNSGPKEKLLTAAYGNNDVISPKVESEFCHKRFLVFDQSGDQTTLIFSSAIGAPVPCFSSWCPKPTVAFDFKRKDNGAKENLSIHLKEISNDQLGESDGADLQSDMHEDTDELNALIYSDDESGCTEDDEITSTGHSPGTVTFHSIQDWFKGSKEEVASGGGSTKRRKLFDGECYSVPSLVDTASSLNPIIGLEYEDDAESRCDDAQYKTSGEICSGLINKKTSKERIQETVSVLQNIIPGGKGKDAVAVLDEAINYLKFLKLKAKALGLDAP